MPSGDPKPTGKPTFLGLALGKLPQELAVLLLQAGQAAVQGSLPALGLPQPLLRVLGDRDTGSEPPPGAVTARSEASQGMGDSATTPERGTAGSDPHQRTGIARSEPSQGMGDSGDSGTTPERGTTGLEPAQGENWVRQVGAIPRDGGQLGQTNTRGQE